MTFLCVDIFIWSIAPYGQLHGMTHSHACQETNYHRESISCRTADVLLDVEPELDDRCTPLSPDLNPLDFCLLGGEELPAIYLTKPQILGQLLRLNVQRHFGSDGRFCWLVVVSFLALVRVYHRHEGAYICSK